MLTLLTIRVLFGLAVLAVFLTTAALATNSVVWLISARSLRQKQRALDPVIEETAVHSARRTPKTARRERPVNSDTSSNALSSGITTVEEPRGLSRTTPGEKKPERAERPARENAGSQAASHPPPDCSPPRLPQELAVDDIIPLQGPVPRPADDVVPIDSRTPPPHSSPAPVNPA